MLKQINCFLSGLIDMADSDGGHLVLLVVLTLVFLNHHADAYLDLAIGALLMKLKDAGSNKNRETQNTVATMTTETKPKE